jgi:cell division protein FtsB
MGLRRPLPRIPPVARRVLVALALAGVAVLLLAPPVRGWWEQRNEISAARDELSAIEADNEELRRRLERIEDPEELEAIARRDLGLVREGEESYTVLPPATAGLMLPDSWPFNRLAPAMAQTP